MYYGTWNSRKGAFGFWTNEAFALLKKKKKRDYKKLFIFCFLRLKKIFI